jgi:hypothetical protein
LSSTAANIMRTIATLAAALSAAVALFPTPAPAADPPAQPVYQDRWLYCQFNLQVEKNADDLVALIDFSQVEAYGKALSRK